MRKITTAIVAIAIATAGAGHANDDPTPKPEEESSGGGVDVLAIMFGLGLVAFALTRPNEGGTSNCSNVSDQTYDGQKPEVDPYVTGC